MNTTETTSKCLLCSGTDYYNEAGLFFCAECHTQAEAMQETICDTEDQPTIVHQKKTLTIKTKKTVEEQGGPAVEWTSWQGHNYVLKGLVDELIKLGAKPTLKIIVLQLWTKYLGKIEAAFFSKTEEAELPKFWFNQHEKDFQVIYGRKKAKKKQKIKKKIKKLPKPTIDKTLDAKAAYNVQRKALLKYRNAVVRSEYERVKEQLSATQDPLSQVDDHLKRFSQQIDVEETPITVEYSKEALRILSMREGKRTTQDLGDSVTDIFSQRVNNTSPYVLTRLKLIALIVLALNLTRAEIQISDLLRWAVEGHLSYYRVAHLFPEHVHFTSGDALFLLSPREHPSYRTLLLTCTKIARLLEVESIPPPDTGTLASRYIVELQLPVELNTFVERLVATSRPYDHDDDDLGVVNYEGITMAYIIVVLKMLFGLDSCTENRISEFAREINRLRAENPDGTRDLFVWDDWVCYLECRKSVLIREHFPTRYRLGGNFANTSLESYLTFVREQQEKDKLLENQMHVRKIDKYVDVESQKFQWAVNQLPNYECKDSPCLTLAPSLTPNVSYIETLLNTHRDGVTIPTHILSQDFTKTTLSFLTEPRKLADFAKTHNLNIDLQEGRAVQTMEIVPKPICSQYDLYGSKNYRNVRVKFVDDKSVACEDNPQYSRGVYKEPSKRKRKRDDDDYDDSLQRKRKKLDFKFFDVPSEVADLLRNELMSLHKPKKDPDPDYVPSKRVTTPKDKQQTSDEVKNLVLYLPHKDYWLFHCQGLHFERSSKEEFETKVAPNLPASFYWLLTQCSQMLQMSLQELYVEVMRVETLLD